MAEKYGHFEVLEHFDVVISGKIIREESNDPDAGLYKILLFISRKSLASAREMARKEPPAKRRSLDSQKKKDRVNRARNIVEILEGIRNFALIAFVLFAIGWLIYMMFFKK